MGAFGVQSVCVCVELGSFSEGVCQMSSLSYRASLEEVMDSLLMIPSITSYLGKAGQ